MSERNIPALWLNVICQELLHSQENLSFKLQFYNSIILLIGSEHLEKFCVFCFGFHIGFSTYSCHKAPAVEHGIALLTNHIGHWNIFSAADFLEHIFCCRFPGTYFLLQIFLGHIFLLLIFLGHIFLEHIFCCRFSWDIFPAAYFSFIFSSFYPSQTRNQSCSVLKGSLCKNTHKTSDTEVFILYHYSNKGRRRWWPEKPVNSVNSAKATWHRTSQGEPPQC